MEKFYVQGEQVSYPIFFANTFDFLLDALEETGLGKQKICIITDQNVDMYYANIIIKQLQIKYDRIFKFVMPPGEKHKHLETIYQIYNFFLENQLDRQSVVIALGGGVVGDMAGFAAATYLRGLPFIQIPTSLLSQVDSSVGGKVGVDFQKHKNLVGSFYQPKFVYINPSTLQTLPTREINAGMAEVIKHGLILDKSYYDFVKQHRQEVMDLCPNTMTKMIRRSCELKSSIVKEDEKEVGLREILNFGHTLGHAIETLLDFTLLHGECVAIGMIGAAYLSYQIGELSLIQFEDIKQTILAYDLPVKSLNIDEIKLYEQLFMDKKVKQDKLSFVLLSKIGEAFRVNQLSEEIIYTGIHYLCRAEEED